MTRLDRFMATVYAMNTLLLDKRVYSRAEFQELFQEWERKEKRKKNKGRGGP